MRSEFGCIARCNGLFFLEFTTLAPTDLSTLEGIAQSVAEKRNAFVVGISGTSYGSRRVIQVFVDTDDGITIAQCAEISRELATIVETQDLLREPYELEVSSPGIEKPLKLLRQYRKNIGRKYNVQYREENERRTLVGILTAVDGERLTFIVEKQGAVSLEFSNIFESTEELPW